MLNLNRVYIKQILDEQLLRVDGEDCVASIFLSVWCQRIGDLLHCLPSVRGISCSKVQLNKPFPNLIFITYHLIVQQSSPSENMSFFIITIANFICATIQIFVNTLFGSQLLDESEEITQAVYASQWMDRSSRCKGAYLIFVERTFRPMTIFAGGLFPLSLPTFVKVRLFQPFEEPSITKKCFSSRS